MSRWWPEGWLAQLTRSIRPARWASPVLLDLPAGIAQAQRADAARAALSAALDERRTAPGGGIDLVLRDDHLRWEVLPWSAALSGPAQREAMARQAFVQTHGHAAQGWTLCLEPARYGAATLACACDTSLLAALHDEAGRRGLRLLRVRPLLAAWLQLQPRRIGRADGWWVTLHGGGMTLLWRQAGQARHLRVCASAGLDPSSVLAREAFTAGADDDLPVHVIDGRGDAAHDDAALPSAWRRLARPAPLSHATRVAAAAPVDTCAAPV